MLKFETLELDGGEVLAKYAANYMPGANLIRYIISSHFVLNQGKITAQVDSFGSVSEMDFVKMAKGIALPKPDLAVRKAVRDSLKSGLQGFMATVGY